MLEKLQRIASDIKELEAQRSQLAAGMRSQKGIILKDALEQGLIKPLARVPPPSRVAAVDGGLLAQEFQGFDLVLSRAVGVLFEYAGGSLSSHEYFPSRSPEPEVDALSSLDTHDFNLHKSLFRIKKELACAISCLEKWKPEYLFLDGSLVPTLSDKPGEGSELKPLYAEVVSLQKQLFEKATSLNCSLAGIIKDSRGKRFLEISSKSIPDPDNIFQRSNDTSFLHLLLEPGERTFSFSYCESVREHQVLKEFGEWGSKILVTYLKPVKGDRPLRVEFLGGPADAQRIAEAAFSLACINEKYAYPAILIEADLRAALDRLELDRAYRDLVYSVGLLPSVLKLRRDSRPFR